MSSPLPRSLSQRVLALLLGKAGRSNVPAGTTDGYDVQLFPEGSDVVLAMTSVGLSSTAALAYSPAVDGARYRVEVRARKTTGRVSEPAVKVLRLISSGGNLVARPNAPTNLQAIPLADGDVRVIWEHNDIDATVEADNFEVFVAGVSGFDFEAPDEALTRLARSVELTGLADGSQQRIVVRAVSAAGATDGNRDVALVVPRNEPPLGPASVLVAQTEY